MHLSAFARVVPLLLVTSGLAGAQGMAEGKRRAPTGAETVEAIAKKPGIYQQSCEGVRRENSLAVVVNFAGRSSDSQHQVSADQFNDLRWRRDEAIAALSAWLKTAGETPEDPKASWNHPTRTKLTMLVDLNAVSCLADMKKLAETYLKAYEAASERTEVDWDHMDKLSEADKKGVMSKVEAGDKLGDVLSAIIAILRQEKFEPLVNSKFEKDAEAAMKTPQKDAWTAQMIKKVKENGGEVPEDDQDQVLVDPVTGAYTAVWAYTQIAMTKESITQVFEWVDTYRKLPAEKRLDAKGMSEWPVNR